MKRTRPRKRSTTKAVLRLPDLDQLHRAHLPHLGDGPYPRTQRHLRKKEIRTDKPGYIVYEDEWQLVAEPFRKGTMPRR